MKNIGSQTAIVFLTMLIFSAALWLNELLFGQLQWVPGIHWVYLPAGVRLLCTFLFAEAGAVGLLLVSWLVCFFYFFPHQAERSLLGGMIGCLAPYAAYRLGRSIYGINRMLGQLSASSLLGLSTFYALLNALLHLAMFVWLGQGNALAGASAMFVGDLLGTLLVLYAVKAVMALRCCGSVG